MDMKEKKLTVIGDVDPVEIVSKLRKQWWTEILTVGPAKEEKKDGEKKEEDKKKDQNEQQKLAELQKAYLQAYNPYFPRYYHVFTEDNPNGCVIS